MKKVDGADTLAANWPTQLTYMSGNWRNLETELLIAYDNLAHSIQKALNCHNIQSDKHPVDRHNKPSISIDRYQIDKDAHISYPDDFSLTDGMPNMASPMPLYNKEVQYEYSSVDEEERKCNLSRFFLHLIFRL